MKLLIAIFLLSLFCGCEQGPAYIYAIDFDKKVTKDSMENVVKGYSLSRNHYRSAHHVPLLPDSFVLFRYGWDFVGWDNTEPGKRPVYHNKLITWTVDSLHSERNFFFGPNDEQLIIWYGMTVDDKMEATRPGYHFSCSFRKKEDVSINIQWSDSTVDTRSAKYIPVNIAKDDHSITIEQADSILRSWGITVH